MGTLTLDLSPIFLLRFLVVKMGLFVLIGGDMVLEMGMFLSRVFERFASFVSIAA